MTDQAKIMETAKAEVETAMNKAFETVAKGARQRQEEAMLNDTFAEQEYVEPIQDPYGKAIKYLEKHNIMQLFQALTASIVYNKPDDPLQSMMKEIEVMKKQSS